MTDERAHLRRRRIRGDDNGRLLASLAHDALRAIGVQPAALGGEAGQRLRQLGDQRQPRGRREVVARQQRLRGPTRSPKRSTTRSAEIGAMSASLLSARRQRGSRVPTRRSRRRLDAAAAPLTITASTTPPPVATASTSRHQRKAATAPVPARRSAPGRRPRQTMASGALGLAAGASAAPAAPAVRGRRAASALHLRPRPQDRRRRSESEVSYDQHVGGLGALTGSRDPDVVEK